MSICAVFGDVEEAEASGGGGDHDRFGAEQLEGSQRYC
jgi:hypothetical protein